MNNDWIKNIKIGDEVIVTPGGIRSGNLPKIRKVEKINKASISVDGTLYNIKDGFERGRDPWAFSYISECTPEKKADLSLRYERAIILTAIHNAEWSKMSIEQLRAIREIINTK